VLPFPLSAGAGRAASRPDRPAILFLSAGGKVMKIRHVTIAWGFAALLALNVAFAQASRLPAGTRVPVRLTSDLVSSRAVVGARIAMEVARPVTLDGEVVIPEGAAAWGVVQAVRKGKVLQFDVEGLRLPNDKIVLLRCKQQKTTHAKKDVINVEIRVGRDLGAPKGVEFTSYLDQDVDVDAAARPSAAN